MIRSNGIRDLIFMLLLVGVMNAIPGLSNAVICVFVGLCYGPWIGLLVITGRGIFWAIVPSRPVIARQTLP